MKPWPRATLLVAHTATVAPADVTVDGRTVFTNIANGEFAGRRRTPAASTRWRCTPPGRRPTRGARSGRRLRSTRDADGRVCAVGTPSSGSMDVISTPAPADREPGAGDPPRRIETGDAGLVGEVGPAYAGG